MLKRCAQCGESFRGKPKRRFCSQACVWESGRDRVACEACGKVVVRPKKMHVRFCSKACSQPVVSPRGVGHYAFLGEEMLLTKQGYYRYTSTHPLFPNQLVHRAVWESQHPDSQCADCGWFHVDHVHHIDGDKQNNAPENLVGLCAACHSRRHAIVKPYCLVGTCFREARARGWCAMHYKRWKAHGDPLIVGVGNKHGRWTRWGL